MRRLRAIGRLREAYADAILAGEESGAERAIRDAIDAGIDECAIDDRIIAPAMRRVGELWAGGEISVAEEHLATHISIRMIALQHEVFRVTARRAGHVVLLGGLENERHTVGLEMAANVLLHAGYDVRMLGADVPLSTLTRAVERYRPSVIGFSMTLATTAAILPAAIYEVRAVDPGVGIILGGPAASLRMEATAATAVCTHVTDAVEIADGLAQQARLN